VTREVAVVICGQGVCSVKRPNPPLTKLALQECEVHEIPTWVEFSAKLYFPSCSHYLHLHCPNSERAWGGWGQVRVPFCVCSHLKWEFCIYPANAVEYHTPGGVATTTLSGVILMSSLRELHKLKA
jgi:hypothetical protein